MTEKYWPKNRNELHYDILFLSKYIQKFYDMPTFNDFSTFEKWFSRVEYICVLLDEICLNQTSKIKKWLAKKASTCYFDQSIGYVHGDLHKDNILMTDEENYFIIDWQRPMIAPLILESAQAFKLAGYDVIELYDEFGRMAIICDIIWYTIAYKQWIPEPYMLKIIQDKINKFNESII
jgi:thiamine kinase-like enzyme